jgi:3-phenylpropionate/cinnamic acid dioxygenase small subunit
MTDISLLCDRLAIEDVFARYAHTADGYDVEGWLNCFAEDGIFEVDVNGKGIQFAGRQALQEFIGAHIRLLPGTRHVMTNHLVELNGDVAVHRCTLTGMLSRPEKVYTFISGWYQTTLERVAGEWKIKHRIVYSDIGADSTDRELIAHLKSFRDWMAANGTIA